MKIAIPVWDGRVSPLMDAASRIMIVEVEGKKERSRFETSFQTRDISRRCIQLGELGADVLICGAISRPFERMLVASSIEVFPGISGNPQDVLEAFFQGTLFSKRFLMPGCKAGVDRHRDHSSFLNMQRQPRRRRMRSKSRRP